MAGRLTWWAFGPMALLLCGWISWGRMLFGISGWGVLLYPIVVVPAIIVLTVPTAIAVMCSPLQPWRFAGAETAAVICAEVAGIIVGLAVPDASDAPNSTHSALADLTGISVNASGHLAWWCAVGAAGAMIAALVLSIVRVAGERRAAAQQPPFAAYPQSTSYPPPGAPWPPRHQGPP